MNINVEEFTVSEKILLAADQLEKQGQSPFSAEALIVTSWQQFPRTFGLKGYAEQFPDSNKVLSSIMGEKGLARRGWLAKMGQKLYSLTREGKHMVRRIQQPDEPEPQPTSQRLLGREQEKFLLSVLGSSAVHKFEENRKQDLTFADGCRFWNIPDSMGGEAVDEQLEKFEKTLLEIDELVSNQAAELSTGRVIDGGELRVLVNIHRFMQDRFDRLLNLLRSRSARR